VGEVRQFETTRIRDALAKVGGYMTTGPKEAYGSLRLGLIEKAKQLRPFAETDAALLIVVANPLGADVMLDDHHVTPAMFGNPGFVIPIDTSTGGPPEGAQMHWRLEDYGVFTSPVEENGEVVGRENRHPHISAVVVVHERLRSADWRHEIMQRHPAADHSFGAATEAALRAIKEIDSAVARDEEPQGAYQWVTVYEVGSEESVPVPVGWFNGLRDERHGLLAEGGYGRIEPSA
jgi:hypothetical protein